MSDRIMKTAADNVADTFNKSELKLSSDKQNVVDYMLFESEDEPSDIAKKYWYTVSDGRYKKTYRQSYAQFLLLYEKAGSWTYAYGLCNGR